MFRAPELFDRPYQISHSVERDVVRKGPVESESGQNIRVHITGGSPQSPTTSVRGTLPGVRGTFAGFAEPSRGL